MDGVFMKKYLKRILICGLFAALCWSAVLISDRKKLNDGLIRFHVVAHSDSSADQAIKCNVRDVVLESIQTDLQKVSDISEARAYLQSNLPKIQRLVNQTLEDMGFSGGSQILLGKERFPVRHYETFSLPAGVYESLRIVIGDGQGKNWWCVSFPTLCLPATSVDFSETAVSAGFSPRLAETLSGNEKYEIRFYFLNQLGKLENLFFEE